jgi:hypothetical protein
MTEPNSLILARTLHTQILLAGCAKDLNEANMLSFSQRGKLANALELIDCVTSELVKEAEGE